MDGMSELPTHTAVHEAGHIVAAKAFGIAVTHVEIVPAAERKEHAAHTHLRWSGASLTDAAAVAMAGPAAQIEAYGDCGPGHLRYDAEEFERICPAGMREEVMAIAWRLIRERWPDVLALARENDRHGTLRTQDLERLGYWWEQAEPAWLCID